MSRTARDVIHGRSPSAGYGATSEGREHSRTYLSTARSKWENFMVKLPRPWVAERRAVE